MMLPTHALAGMAAALPYALAAPEFGGLALLAGFGGGLVPDLDLYVGHRKSLHFPVYYPLLAVPALGVVAVSPSAVAVAAAFLLVGAALHSLMDVLGGGLELYPWAATSDRAVYDHFRGRWLSPRRVVPYDGSPEDLGLAAFLGLPLVLASGSTLRPLVVAALVVAMGYAVVRRRLPDLAVRLLDLLGDHAPDRALSYLPDRYVRAQRSATRTAGR